ncbi:MAG: hypothetical protein V4522_04380, partial [Pseudomonadota bacterium]
MPTIGDFSPPALLDGTEKIAGWKDGKDVGILVDQLISKATSFAEIARTNGLWGVLPTDSDKVALNKFADYAITQNPGFQSTIPGPPDNTYTNLERFRASDVTLKVAKLVGIESIPDGEFFFKTDAPPYVEDGITTIKADSTRLDEGAWVRQKGNAIGYQWAGTPTDVDSALRNLPTLLDAFAKTTQTQIIAGTWTGDLSTAIRAAVQGKDHFVIPPGTFPFKGDIVEVTTPGLVVHGMGGVLKKMGGSGSDGVGILVSTHAQLLNIHIDATDPNPTLGGNYNDLLQVDFTPETPSSRVFIQNLKAKGSSSNVLVHRGGLLEVDGLFAWNTYANGL